MKYASRNVKAVNASPNRACNSPFPERPPLRHGKTKGPLKELQVDIFCPLLA
jgi:hypothetical protein